MNLHSSVPCARATLFLATLLAANAALAATPYKMRIPIGPIAAAAAPVVGGLVLSENNTSFGSIALTDQATHAVTLSNTGATPAAVAFTGPELPFGMTHDCPASLAAAAICTLTLSFTPTATGTANGSVVVTDGPTLALSGFGDGITVAGFYAGLGTWLLATDGSVWTTGANTYGQMGHGNTTTLLSFTKVAALGTDVAHIAPAAGLTSILRKKDGTWWGAGYNTHNQTGVSTTIAGDPALVFNQITALGSNVADIQSGSGFTLALKGDGTVWAIGDNASYQFGVALPATSYNWMQLTGLGSNNAAIYVGSAHSVVRKTDGTVWVAGGNSYGQLGVGTTSPLPSPRSFTRNTALEGATWLKAGSYNTYLRKPDGTIWATGHNLYGQLGLGDLANRTVPTLLTGLGSDTTSLDIGTYHSVAVKADGSVLSSGRNSTYGQLALGDFVDRSAFTQVLGSGSATAAEAGADHVVVKMSDGTLKAAGRNLGELGTGTNGSPATTLQPMIMP